MVAWTEVNDRVEGVNKEIDIGKHMEEAVYQVDPQLNPYGSQ